MKRKMFPVAVHLFLVDKKNILLLKKHSTDDGDGNYGVITGHLDGNEDVYDAIIREAKEEAGIRILLEEVKIVQVMHRKNMDEERIDYFLLCRKWEGNIRNREMNKRSELKWCPIDDLPNNTTEYIKYAVNGYLNKINFTLFGW